MVYFSELKGKPVFDCEKTRLGSLVDFVLMDAQPHATVTHIVYRDEEGYKKKVIFDSVKQFTESPKRIRKDIEINLLIGCDDVQPFFVKPTDLMISDIMDRQVVDVTGAKMVRVNDVVLSKVDERLCVIAVSVGMTSFMRRLGIGFLIKKNQEQLIPWDSFESLDPKVHGLHLKMQRDKIKDLYPGEIADVMEDLSHKQRALIFRSLDKDKAAETLIDAKPEVQESVLKNIKMERMKELLENIPADQAADILSLIADSERGEIMSMMEKDSATNVKKILDYPEESAAAIMRTEFLSIRDDCTIEDTLNFLRKAQPKSKLLYHIYVTDKDDHLLGVLSVRWILTAQPNKRVGDLMNKDVISVHMNTSKEEIAKTIAKYDLFVLPVVDDNNALKGIVMADDALKQIVPDWKKHRYNMHRKRRFKNGNKAKV
jgi:magnesium transporter